MKTIAARLSQQYPESNGEWGVRLENYHDWLIGPEFERMLWILMTAVGFVLLIACGNTANLLLARATARRREIAIRLAVGSTRARMTRQLLTESILLALIGGALGLLLAYWGVSALRAAEPENLPRVNEVSLDARVLWAALVASFASAIIFGLTPAVQSRIGRLNDFLKSAGRLSGTNSSTGRTRDVLVVGEVALAVVLLIAAGLMGRSYWRLSQVDTGFRTERLLMLQVSPAAQRYTGDKLSAFYDEVLRRIQSLPGVEGVGGVNVAPLVGGSTNMPFTIAGRAHQPDQFMAADWRAVSPGFFNAAGISLVKGRLIEDGDARGNLRIIINRTMADRWWRNEDPIGKSILFQGGRNTAEIVGIVGDVRDANIAEDVQPIMYLHHAKIGWPSMTLLVRAAVPPASLEHPIREQVWSVDKEIPVRSLGTIDEAAYSSLAQPRFSASLLAIFSGLALLLAAVGVYGLLAYAVAQRTQEIGIRMAIGAQRSDILGMVLRRGLALVAVGIALGGALALALTRLMSTVLFGVGAADPLTFSVVAALLGAVGLLAILVPARRAAQLNPLVALRYE
jgi:predicted permease